MQTADFDYDLPESFIAQTPTEPRDSSRLMALNRRTGEIQHLVFHQIAGLLRPGDALVMNRTRVIPARLPARKETGGKAEILLLRRESERVWECLVGGKGLDEGKRLKLADGLEAEIVSRLEGSRRLVQFSEAVETHLPRDGQMPLPPYIHEKLRDPERYQTVYAKTPGSAAAPTAGLHFTPRLLEEIRQNGVELAEVTLHVGLDTFAPVTETDPRDHQIHSEWCEVTPQTADRLNAVKAAGGRVIAVGTTSARTLESAAQSGKIQPFSGATSIFILPGYTFRAVDAIITNFHLPKSTLLMMLSAFAGRETMLTAYETAKSQGYRFFSFGDAMFVE